MNVRGFPVTERHRGVRIELRHRSFRKGKSHELSFYAWHRLGKELFSGCGHTVKLMAPKFVTPYRKSGKNDDNDGEAICEAVSRPNMRCVPVKSAQQQADLSLHQVRQGIIEARTATLNRIRGLLAESG